MITTNICVSAESTVRSANSFTESWERYASTPNREGSLTYGFNTFAINEDYVWAQHDTEYHYAALFNGDGWHTGQGRAAGILSRVDVRHKGSSVTYYLYY